MSRGIKLSLIVSCVTFHLCVQMMYILKWLASTKTATSDSAIRTSRQTCYATGMRVHSISDEQDTLMQIYLKPDNWFQKTTVEDDPTYEAMELLH